MEPQTIIDIARDLIETGHAETQLEHDVCYAVTSNTLNALYVTITHPNGSTIEYLLHTPLRLTTVADNRIQPALPELRVTQFRPFPHDLTETSRRFLNKYMLWGYRIERHRYVWYINCLYFLERTEFTESAYFYENTYSPGIQRRYMNARTYKMISDSARGYIARLEQMWLWRTRGSSHKAVSPPSGQCRLCLADHGGCNSFELHNDLATEEWQPGLVIHAACALLGPEERTILLDALEQLWFAETPSLPLTYARYRALLRKIILPYIRGILGFAE